MSNSPSPRRAATWTANIGDSIIGVSLSPDATHAACATFEGQIFLVETASGNVGRSLASHAGGTFHVAWHPTQPLVASTGQDGRVKITHPSTCEVVSEFEMSTAWVEHLAWSPDGSWLAAAAGKGVSVWNANDRTVLKFEPEKHTVGGLAWRPDSKQLTVACYGGLNSYDIPDLQRVDRFHWPSSLLTVAWAPNQRWLVAGTQDRKVQIWEIPFEPETELAMSGYPGKVRLLAWHPSGRFLATGSGQSLMAWDFGQGSPQGTEPRMLDDHPASLTSLQYQSTGHLLASGCEGGCVRIWNVGRSLHPLREFYLDSPIHCLAWPRTAHWVLAGTRDGTLSLLDTPKP